MRAEEMARFQIIVTGRILNIFLTTRFLSVLNGGRRDVLSRICRSPLLSRRAFRFLLADQVEGDSFRCEDAVVGHFF